MALKRYENETDEEYEKRCEESRRRWIESEEKIHAQGISTDVYKTYFIYSPAFSAVNIGKTYIMGENLQDEMEKIKMSIFYPKKQKLDKNMIFLGIVGGNHTEEFYGLLEKYEMKTKSKRSRWFYMNDTVYKYLSVTIPEELRDLRNQGIEIND